MGRKQRIKEQNKVEESRNISRAIREKDKGALYYIIYIGLIILLLYPPYFRGMFFDKEFLPTHIYSGILFLLYIIYKTKILKEHRFLQSPMDYAAIALVGAYFLSIFVAVNIRSAVGEFLKYINYFIAFYMVSDFARTEKDIRVILWVMVLSAFGVAFIGIGAAAGTFTYNGAFVGGRINSTLQYPNTLAAYLTAAFMISTTLWATATSRLERGILAFINYSFFLCFLFTLSRGAWLLFPVFFLILIIGISGSYRLKALGYSIQTLVSAIIASPGYGSAIDAAQKNKAWIWYIAGAVISIAIFYIVEISSERFAFNMKPKAVLSVFVILVVLGGIGGYAAVTTETPLTLAYYEKDEAEKINWISTNDIKQNTEYTLKVNAVHAKNSKLPLTYCVYIESRNGNSEFSRLLTADSEILETEKSTFNFKTADDTEYLYIGFSNVVPETKVIINSLMLIQKNKDIAKKISLGKKYIPQNISKRLSSITIGEHSLVNRFLFYHDALKIIKDYPVFGTGGGGWKSIYFAYQSYQYFTTEVHNFFLQLWVETGTVGLIAMIALWFILLMAMYKVFKSDISITVKALTCGVFSGAIALSGHSVIDFNLSLGGVALYLWQLFGVIKSSEVLSNPQVKGKQLKASWAFLPLGGLSCVMIILSFLLYQGYAYSQQAVKSIEQQQDIISAREYFEKAAKYDPYTSSYKADIAQLDYIIAKQTENDDLLKKSEQMRLEAIKLDPYNYRLRNQLAAHYLEQGKLDKGILELEKATKVNPFNIENWENLANAYQKAVVVNITQDQKEKALEITTKSQELFDKISEYNSKAPQNTGDKIKVTNNLMLYIYKSKLLAENIDDENYYKKLNNLVFVSDFTIDADNDGVPDLWQISNSPKGLLEVDIGKDVAQLINKGEEQSYLITKEDFTLEPATEYTLSLVIGSDNPENKPIFTIFSRKDKSIRHQLKDIALSPETTSIFSTFVTTEDTEEGAQWIRIDIPENTKDEVFIGSIEIWLK